MRVDAAVATALALAVVEPMMSGLGGDGFYHVFDAASGRAVVFNATGPAPLAATPERYTGGIPRTGPMSVSVPGLIAGLGAMHRQFGRLPWRDLFAEAIHYARDGFGATAHYRHFAGEHCATLAADRRSAAVFLHDGSGADARCRDRASRSRPHPRRDRRRGRRVSLSRHARPPPRRCLRRRRRAGGRSRSRANSRPSARSRSPSTTAA